MAETRRLEADVVIAGSGPGGCAVAKELSAKGKKVIMVEKGSGRTPFLGTPLGIFLKLEKEFRLPMPTRKTVEGEDLILANGFGGGTLIYAGSAFLPDSGQNP